MSTVTRLKCIYSVCGHINVRQEKIYFKVIFIDWNKSVDELDLISLGSIQAANLVIKGVGKKLNTKVLVDKARNRIEYAISSNRGLKVIYDFIYLN